MSYEIIWEKKGVKVIARGGLSDGFLDVRNKATQDTRFADAEYAIVDLQEVSTFPVDASLIQLIAAKDAQAYLKNPDIKMAIVASNLAMRRMTNMWEVYFELNNEGKRWNAKMFENESQARKWIETRQENEPDYSVSQK